LKKRIETIQKKRSAEVEKFENPPAIK